MVVRVPVGTLVADLLAFAGGPRISDYRVVDGGPMMGRVLPDTKQSVTKTTSGLIVLPPDHTVVARKVMDPERVRRITATICCQCSLCTDLCPRNLLGHRLRPHLLMRAAGAAFADSPAAREALLCSECGICEKFACPMQVSPREVNAQIKRALMTAGVRWDAEGRTPVAHPFRNTRYVPTSRLMQRLDVIKYDTHPGLVEGFAPQAVEIALKQHIGAPATCVVAVGDRVAKGDLIGEIPDKALGARVHASIDGTVTSVANGKISIRA
jgi:Na+-translocating ferredoxin:NAD+ oxidoreductase RnfC subunit